LFQSSVGQWDRWISWQISLPPLVVYKQTTAGQGDNPQQNAYIERYNRTVRQEWLNQNIFETIVPLDDCMQSPAGQGDAQEQAAEWLWTYNNPSHGLQANPCRAADRPNMAIGGITPAMKLKLAA